MAEKFRQRWAIVPAVVAAELDDDGTLDIADTDSTMLTIEGPPPLAVED